MPTADATLLPPPYSPSPPSPCGSARRLDEVGVENILGAMIEQKKRASQPRFAAIALEQVERYAEDAQPPGGRRAPPTSEVFLKAR